MAESFRGEENPVNAREGRALRQRYAGTLLTGAAILIYWLVKALAAWFSG